MKERKEKKKMKKKKKKKIKEGQNFMECYLEQKK